MADRCGCALGVDVGVSAAKLALLAPDGSPLRTLRIDAHRFGPDDLLPLLSPAPAYIAATGMGAERLGCALHGVPVRPVDEFTAIAVGALRLTGLPRALVASVGTGTAFVMAESGAAARHLGGSGVGGGTLLGLADLVDGVADAPHLLDLAARGELRRVDLCIGDVTGRDIPGLPPCTTVANLARRQAEASAADRARGAVNLVCQTVGVLAAFAARAEGVGDVVLVGTPVAHPVFSELIRMVELLHPVRFHVPPHAPFAAAIGAARAALSPANE